MTHRAGAASLPQSTPGAAGVTDPTAWRALFDAHWRWVYATVQRLGGPGLDVEDAVQDVFVVLVQRLASFEGRSQLRTWIYRICLNIVSEHRRKAARRRRLAQALTWVGFARRTPTVEEEVASQRDLARVHRLLGRLDPAKRAVFILREVEGLSGDEVADILEIPTATVRTRLFHARRIFAKLAREEEAPYDA